MSAGTLWTYPGQHKGKIAQAVATLAGIAYELPKDYTHFETNLQPEYLAKFPHGKIPAWESKDGFKVFEAAAIARYFAGLTPNSGLLGSTLEEAALVDQWAHLAESEVDASTDVLQGIARGRIPYSETSQRFIANRQLRTLKTLESHISSRTFFVGERVTLADIYVAGVIYRGVGLTIDASVRSQIPNLIRHLEAIVSQPQLKDIFGPTNYIEKAITFTPPPKVKEDSSN